MRSAAMYLVRGPDGTMSTVVAHSNRGALKLYLFKHPELQPGDFLSVKQRGATEDWTDYKVGRR